MQRTLPLVVIGSLLLTPVLAGDVTGTDPTGPPNVLIIMTDDHRRADTLEFMPKTMAWFREDGTDYTQAFSAAAICCPARSTVWVGQYIHNSGVFTTALAGNIDEDASIQRYLQDAGYTTAAFGKFFNSYPLTRTPKYFDDWAFHGSGYTNVAFNDHGVRRTVDYSPLFIKGRAQGFLAATEANDTQPWYVYLTPYAPHSPWIPEEKYANVLYPPWLGNPATQEVDRTDKPQHVQATVPLLSAAAGAPFDKGPEAVTTLAQVSSNVPFDRQIYLRTLLTVDDMVDEIMTQLEAQGELENTLVIFTADQGLLWGEHGWYNKMVPYTDSIQVPFFLRYPAGGVAAGAST
ncbi:MAG TPA: sulfatase-like hydrolase/transferase, partial [Candidatus Thermoplasmatota archaeon]|nr:sulfatase-like hydrolase/transferase [Candidatus Thermoplasmatota archaeon]